jgi:hypothetical protein
MNLSPRQIAAFIEFNNKLDEIEARPFNEVTGGGKI